MTPEEIARASADRMWEFDAVRAAQDMELVSVGPGVATIAMRVRPDMLNSHGICHGGHIFTLADAAFAFACNGYNQRTVGHQAAITYMAPGRRGDRLTATARELYRGKRDGIYDVSVTNGRGERIAEFRGHSRTVKGTHLPE